MESVVINRPIRVLVRVTEDFKEKLHHQATSEISRIESELEQLQFQRKRWMAEVAKKDPKKMEQLRESLDREHNAREQRKMELQRQLRQSESLEAGELVQQGTVDAKVEVSPGDSWEEIINTAIVVEDGKIVEIRHGSNED